MKDYNKENIPLAKALRRNMTPWERKLWYDFLRNYPIRFQRQKVIGNYIADFYCAKARLVIELDGGGHYTPEQTRKDELRTDDLASMKLTVVRICNLDIDRNFRGVCAYIDRAVRHSLPQSASLTAPSSEGALDGAASEHKEKSGLLTKSAFAYLLLRPPPRLPSMLRLRSAMRPSEEERNCLSLSSKVSSAGG